MKRLLAAFAGIAISAGVTAAPSAITLTPVAGGQFAGTFSGSAASESFILDLSGFSGNLNLVTSLLTANSLFNVGFDITNATFNGLAFTPVVNTTVPGITSVDYWSYNGPVSAMVHTLTINGMSLGGGSFNGSVAVTTTVVAPPAVPEPETYAMMLAGLAAIGFLARRRG